MEVEAVTHALRWIVSRGDSHTTHAIILTDSMSLWVYCPGHAGVKVNDQAAGLAGQETLTSGLLLRRSGPVCMEEGFATLPVNATQAVATVAVRIWFGSHAWVTEGPAGN